MSPESDDDPFWHPSAEQKMRFLLESEEYGAMRLFKAAKTPEEREVALTRWNRVRTTSPPMIRDDATSEDVLMIFEQRAEWFGIPYKKRKEEQYRGPG